MRATAVNDSVVVEVRRGAYHDSVTLMQVSRTLTGVDGVTAAQVAMGTELNLELMRGMGFEMPDGAGPNDLVLALRAVDAASVERARAALDTALTASSSGGGGAGFGAAPPPHTIGAAARRTPGANLALVSVPGPHAFTEAMDALESGLSVMLFSDNVPVEAEVRLKDEGARRGLLVMGPDCGTASVAGVGLGFANAVPEGPVGIVAASGTGAQQLMSLLAGARVGVSHCLGVGGRDLSTAVSARSTRQALAMLDNDEATELIVVVSKPAPSEVSAALEAYAAGLTTPVQFAVLGRGQPDLTGAAARAVEATGASWTEPRSWPAPERRTGGCAVLRGLFAGGTLCDEAMVIASDLLGAEAPVRSNIPLDPSLALGADLQSEGHLMIDFGDDALTQGRAHPMIDQRTRLDRIAAEAHRLATAEHGADGGTPSGAVLLLDVVLGHGAHPDPASELAPALADAIRTVTAAGHELAVVVSLCGTADDPQGLERQANALVAAGASVHLSNAAAARTAVELLGVSA
ncbi:MAG: FdrA family protein [Actinomycetes bacterium]